MELSKCEDLKQDGNSQIEVENQEKGISQIGVRNQEGNSQIEAASQEESNRKLESPQLEREKPVDAVAQTSIAATDHDSSFELLKTDRALEANSSSFSTSSLDTSNTGRNSIGLNSLLYNIIVSFCF